MSEHLSTVVIRPDIFKPDWIRNSPHGAPVHSVAGPEANLCRRIVRNTFSRRRLIKVVDANRMTDDEHWVASVGRWVRRVNYLKLNPARFPGIPPAVVTSMARCSPSGYKLEDPHQLPWRYCDLNFCVYCHARRVRSHYTHLVKAFTRRPKGAPVWVAHFGGVGVRTRPWNLIRSMRPAAAVSFVVPPDKADPTTKLQSASGWGFNVVALSDSKARLVHPSVKSKVYRVRSKSILAYACAKAFQYPKWWAYAPPAEFARLLVQQDKPPYRGLNLWALYGAARTDYVPGVALLDYTATDHKLEELT